MSPSATRDGLSAGSSEQSLAQRDAWLASLISASAAGDCSAFETFYDRTFGYAQSVARRLLHGSDIEDLLADAYFEAWRNAARFDSGRGSAVTWLLTIVRSRALDALRRQASRPEVAAPDAAALDDAVMDEQSDPIDRLWQRQSSARLHVALTALSCNERWTLGLAYFRDCSQVEIAQLTGMPLGTVKSLMLRAQTKLRDTLQSP